MDNKKLLGQRIKKLRKIRRITQEQLSELINIETTSLSGIESGRHFPSMTTLEKIADNLNVELRQLFDFKDFSIDKMKSDIINNIDKFSDEHILFMHKIIEDYINPEKDIQ